MSQYYNIKGLKVRVSDHEPNDRLNGTPDIELYVKSADNRLLSVTGQLERICDRRDYNLSDFQEVVNEWQDGSYDKDVFVAKVEEVEEIEYTEEQMISIRIASEEREQKRIEKHDEIIEKLQGYTLDRFASHSEIKSLSEKTGVSQSYIKKHFNIR